MNFQKYYNLISEDIKPTVVEENLKTNLKLAALAAFFGLQVASFPTINKQIKRYLNRMTPEKMQVMHREIDYAIDHPTPELLDNAKKIEELSQSPEEDYIPNKESSKSSFMKKAAKFIANNEGFHNEAYPDVYGKLTIGIGHLIIPDDIKNGVLKDGEYTLGDNGKVKYAKLSNERVYRIFLNDVQNKINRIQNSFPNYDEYPEPLKVAILDGYFRGDISGSPKTVSLIRSAVEACIGGDLEEANRLANEAANEFLNNKEYKTSVKNETGVHKRMGRLAEFIRFAFDENHNFDYVSSSYK
jgi:hypothetical protein